MAQMLSDGTIVPSYLSTTPRGVGSGSTAMLNDYVLRQGEVKKIIYPDDPQSYGKKTIEYEIEVQYREGNSTYTTATYRGCTLSTVFGGAADRLHATLRPDGSGSNSTIGTGAKVLVLCLAGDQQKAIILGGVEDPAVARKESKDAGHNLFFEFNGVRFTVDDSGQATLTFRGKTKSNGQLSDKATADAEGTSVKLTKDGSITIATPKDAQYIKLDHANKKISILADQDWDVKVNNKLSFTVQNDLSILSTAGKMDIQTAGNVNIKSSGVNVGLATDNWMKGSTYRRAQSILHTQLTGTLSALAGLISTAGASFTTGTALNAIPIVGGLLAAPAFGAAGAALTSAGPLFGTMTGFISSFEAQSATFLSLTNKTD